jgi:hypothetical protein
MPASGQMKSIFRATDGKERRFGIADQTKRRFQTAAPCEKQTRAMAAGR